MVTAKKRVKRTSVSDPVFNGFMVVEPKTDNQAAMMEHYRNGMHVVATGSAGTGKTFLALALALDSVIKGHAKHIKIVRSAVSGRDIGFLPGDEDEKMGVYEAPYRDIVTELLGRGDAYDILKTKGVIHFESTSFLRGTSWNDTVIVADEIQNYNAGEINTLMTRIGKNTRAIVVGDLVQTDLSDEESGFNFLMKVAPKMGGQFGIIRMTHEDIVRSAFVKAWIIACEKHTDFYRRGHG